MEKELREAFEQVTTTNVKAILEHANKTRTMLREAEKRIDLLQVIINGQNKKIDQLRIQLSAVQAKVYKGGTV